MRIKKQADQRIAKLCAHMIYLRYRALFDDIDFIVPVPSHWSRLLARGYNPASIIASPLSNLSKVPLCNLLKRTRRTSYQKDKNAKQRFENTKDAFRCKVSLSGKKVLLVDDVLTTGATLEACAKELHKHECREARCITICSTNAR